VIDNFYVDFFKLKKDTKADDYLFISRERSKKRPILNENEVENFFKKKGFKICFSSQLTIDQRINTFGKAKCLAGVFSAGLANLIFAINCKKIIFIEHPLYSISKEYIKICKKRNIDVVIVKKNKIYKFFYKILSIILSPLRKKTLVNTNNSDFWKVDIQNLKKFI
jgi:capsular polysaccharide biosynthesis protein